MSVGSMWCTSCYRSSVAMSVRLMLVNRGAWTLCSHGSWHSPGPDIFVVCGRPPVLIAVEAGAPPALIELLGREVGFWCHLADSLIV